MRRSLHDPDNRVESTPMELKMSRNKYPEANRSICDVSALVGFSVIPSSRSSEKVNVLTNAMDTLQTAIGVNKPDTQLPGHTVDNLGGTTA